MDDYAFFLEYDGKKTNSKAYNSPVDHFLALHIRQAIDKFCRKNHLVFSNYDALPEGGYRAFLEKRALFKGKEELVFFIKNEPTQH